MAFDASPLAALVEAQCLTHLTDSDIDLTVVAADGDEFVFIEFDGPLLNRYQFPCHGLLQVSSIQVNYA